MQLIQVLDEVKHNKLQYFNRLKKMVQGELHDLPVHALRTAQS